MSIAPTFTTLKDQADRGADGAIPPGDREEEHEDNTFNLPNGLPIAREYRRWLKRIQREVLRGLAHVVVVPVDYPDLRDWGKPFADAMTPVLAPYWDEAGKETRARLGLDPDEWRVVDPHLHAEIVNQAHSLCDSTLATTAETVGEAYRKLNAELLAGLVDGGETVPELAKRVRSVFTGLSRDHATLIARTEASRAVHQASELSAKESGVVSGKVWLLSSNACKLCHELEARSKAEPIHLGNEFASVGSNPTYSSIRMPPAHPRCRCSVTYRLTPEYQALVDANPPATFRPGALGPEPKETPALKPGALPPAEADALKATESQLGVTFAPASVRGKGFRTVVADVHRLDGALRAADPQGYVGPGGTGAAVSGRYEEFQRFLEQARSDGTPVEPPQAFLDTEGEPAINDGRHRWAVLRDAGARALPVAVRKGDLAKFRERFGVT